MSDFIDDLYRDNANTIFLADEDLNAVEYVKMTEYRRVCAERALLQEGHRRIKGFAEDIRDNADTEPIVRRRANNIISWICINAALQEDRDDLLRDMG